MLRGTGCNAGSSLARIIFLSLPGISSFLMLRSMFSYRPKARGEEPLAAAPRGCSQTRPRSCASLPPLRDSRPWRQALLCPRGPILPAPHLPEPPVGAEATRRWQRAQPPSRTPGHPGKANSHGLQPPTAQPRPRRQRPGTRRDQLSTWPFHLKLLKLSAAPAVFLD